MRARRIRVLRGLVAAAMATFFAAFSHAVSGADAPGLFALVAASVLAAVVCIVLASRSLSPVRLAASVVASQLGYHLLFALAPAAHGTVAFAPGHHAQMVMMTTDVPTHVHASASPIMWLGHALAAAVTFAVLLRGEQLLAALVDTLLLSVRVLFRLLRLAPLERPALPGADWLPVLIARQRILLSAMRHRGPPAMMRRAVFSVA
ncbi:hypothetical protein L1277_001617 [Okibacterium sp. HSC-33S16]|uniref:hypothetical protein n=1 Tax=Okibacterium sp. HSC-33S16 TaxID=2910965 RepID=UPI00209F31FA|nr:hypothetical protein [Okibacterium sp. HSC-33S16]MCP2031526.1 hypothetical protein [Okibacterium sp. HSC-33S16]